MGGTNDNYNYWRMALTEDIEERIWDLFARGKSINQISMLTGASHSSVDIYLTRRLKETRIGDELTTEKLVPSIVIPPRQVISKSEALNDYNYRVFIAGYGSEQVKELSVPTLENETVGSFNRKTYKD